jgi:hypothetical protein
MNDLEFQLRRQAEAAKRLFADLRMSDMSDDEELVMDTIEGETGLIEAIEAGLDELDECEVMITGLKAKETAFSDRRSKIERRAERIKALIEQAMIATEQTTLRLPRATLTLAKRAPSVIVNNEADIPAKFWIEQDRPAPKLDKKALGAALKANEAIPGASLDNGSVSLSVRSK